MWFVVIVAFMAGGVEYTPTGRAYNSFEECDATVDHSINAGTPISVQCFEKDILIVLLKNQKK